MDVARPAFVRHLALDKYREVEDMRETLGFDAVRAAAEACTFLERGRYRELWRRHWRDVVVPAAGQAEGAALIPAMEQALGGALVEESAAREATGDRPIDEEPEYRQFIDASAERIRREGADMFEGLG